MALPPSANLDGISLADGIKAYSSDAAVLDMLNSLHLLECILGVYVVYSLGIIFTIDLESLANFGSVVYHTVTDWLSYLNQDTFAAQNAYNLPRRIREALAQISNPTITRIEATPRSILDAYTLLSWLTRTRYSSTTQSETIIVETHTLPNRRSIAMIHGLPSDISAPELRRFLETTLWTQYKHEMRRERIGNAIPNNADSTHTTQDTKHAVIDTWGSGLWRRSCLRGQEGTVPFSGTSVSASSASVAATPVSSLSSFGSA